MRTLARFLVIGSLAAVLSGCLGGSAPDVGQASQAMRKVDARELPADLMSCNAFYGEDWDTPDALIGVKGNPTQVVLVQAGEMICTGEVHQLNQQLLDVDLGSLVPLGGEGDAVGVEKGSGLGGASASAPLNDSNPLPATPVGGESAESPVDDSNPLPAKPADGESASAPLNDSNPLPATPAGCESAESPVDDSNPLPAHTSSTSTTSNTTDNNTASQEIPDLLTE